MNFATNNSSGQDCIFTRYKYNAESTRLCSVCRIHKFVIHTVCIVTIVYFARLDKILLYPDVSETLKNIRAFQARALILSHFIHRLFSLTEWLAPYMTTPQFLAFQ